MSARNKGRFGILARLGEAPVSGFCKCGKRSNSGRNDTLDRMEMPCSLQGWDGAVVWVAGPVALCGSPWRGAKPQFILKHKR